MVFDPSAARSGQVLSDNPNYRGSWLCYINGIEVPITGFTVTSGVWQIPQFQIYMLPDPDIEDLGAEDRVQVALFYLDQWFDSAQPEWRLLADGEIIGRSMMHVNNQRVQSFTCLANIQVFQQLYFFFMNTVDDIVAAQSPEIAAQGLTSAGLFYPYSLFHQGLSAPQHTGESIVDPNNPNRHVANTVGTDSPTTDDDPIKAPYELVYNVIRGIIGKNEVPDTNRSVPMMNFFARHARKVRLQNRFVRLPIFEDIANLNDRRGVFPVFNAARNDEALAAMQRSMAARISNAGPVWNTLQQTLGSVYMEIGMVPNPACVTTNLQGEIQGLLEASVGITDQTPSAPDVSSALANAVASTASSPNNAEDVTSPAGLHRAIESIDAIARAARAVVVGDEQSEDLRRITGDFREGRLSGTFNEVITRFVGRLRVRFGDTAVQQNADFAALQQLNSRAGRPLPQAPSEIASRPATMGIDPTTPVRLAQNFVKPQFMFGVAPMCNVFFPSIISQWSDDENYINQPTRIYVNDSVMTRLMRSSGPNREFMLHALTVAYPEEADAVLHNHMNESSQGQPGHGDPRSTGKDLLIWPEENFKGPVTAHMELPSWFQMLMQARNSSTGSTPATGPGAVAPVPSVTAPPPAVTSHTVVTPAAPVIAPPTAREPVVATTTPLPFDDLAGRNRTPDGTLPYIRRSPRGHLSVNATRIPRFVVRAGTGLDPSTYIEPAYTRLWPAEEDTRPATNRRLARVLRLFISAVAQDPQFSALTQPQRVAVAFGAMFTAYNEGNISRAMHNWNFGNVPMHNNLPKLNWSIDPGSRVPYLAGTTPEVGAANYLRILFGRSFAFAKQVLLGQRPLGVSGHRTTEFYAMADPVLHRNDAFWAQYGNIRPDYFYAALGYNGYYQARDGVDAALSDRMGPATRGMLIVVGRHGSGDATTEQRFRGVLSALQGLDADTVSVRLDPRRRVFASEADEQALGITHTLSPVIATTAAPSNTAVPNSDAPSTPDAVSPRVANTSVVASTVQVTPGPTATSPRITVVTRPAGAPISSFTLEGGDNPSPPQSFERLFRIYAQYEFLRQRYMQRTMAVQTVFNPYVIAGFPCVLLDSFRTNQHRVGYVMAVQHTGFAGQDGQASWSTNVTAACVRRFREFLNDIRNDCNRFAERVASAPAEIVPEIRQIIQDAERSEEFYQRFLYGNSTPDRLRHAAFHFEEVLGFASGNNTVQIQIQGQGVAEAARTREAADAAAAAAPSPTVAADPTAGLTAETARTAAGVLTVTHNLDDVNLPLQAVPNSPYALAFDRADVAMEKCSRPVCTLAQYIRFWHGGKTLGQCILEGFVEGEENDAAYVTVSELDVTGQRADSNGQAQPVVGMRRRKPATYWRRIYRFREGPGDPPTENQRGYTLDPAGPSAGRQGLPSNYPQTRAHWEAVLLAYREKVRSRIAPGL